MLRENSSDSSLSEPLAAWPLKRSVREIVGAGAAALQPTIPRCPGPEPLLKDGLELRFRFQNSGALALSTLHSHVTAGLTGVLGAYTMLLPSA